MDDPLTTERASAIRAVEGAWADGRLREVDRNLRVEALQRAQTSAELSTLVADLAPATYTQLPPEPVPPDPPEEPALARPAPDPVITSVVTPVAPAARVGRRVPAVAAAAVILGLGGWLAVAAGGDDAAVGGSGGTDVDLFTSGDFADLIDDLEDERGSAELFNAVLYPTYASVDAPVDASSQRTESYYWDGDLDEPGSKGTTDDARFDLAGIDHAVLASLVSDVRGRVDDPTTWYAIVHAPREDDGSVFQAYATNEYGETAFLLATADGTVTYRSDPST